MNDFPINLVTAQTPYIGLAHGLIGIFLFRFRNPNKDYINLISFATGTIFLTEIVFFKTTETIGLITWFISGVGLLTMYGLRFRNKTDKDTLDYFKCLAIGLVVCYPINFYTYNWYSNKWDILIALGYLIVPISGTIYFYDRWILKPEKMKRKFVTVLIIQTVLILTALAFGFVKNAEKERMTEMADRNAKLADENAMKANELREELENCR
jgi:hypothetical protein